MKYEMDHPAIALFPLESRDTNEAPKELTYPDYKPWKDPTQLPLLGQKEEYEKVNNLTYLNKGYFEPSQVSNEYYSARTFIQATIFSSTENCNSVLKELSQHLVNAYKIRNEVINKIRYESHSFSIPPRVTLTALKKEAWLRDLASPEVPLLKISAKVPHGIRSKVLIDILVSRHVPMTKALWFTKCVLFGEWLSLRKKVQARSNSSKHDVPEQIEIHWLQEWTEQLSDYVYKYSKDMSNILYEKKKIYMDKLSYLLQYCQRLYIEQLIDKVFFLSTIIQYFKRCLPMEPSQLLSYFASRPDSEESGDSTTATWLHDVDLGHSQRLMALTMLKIFWIEVLKYDYLCKELSELLLLNYFIVQKAPTNLSKSAGNPTTYKHILPSRVKMALLEQFANTINYLFKYNANVFIIPNSWMMVQESLRQILLFDPAKFLCDEEKMKLNDQFQLIKYRNESLMLNMRNAYGPTGGLQSSSPPVKGEESGFSVLELTKLERGESTGISEEALLLSRGPKNDFLNFIRQLDLMKLDDDLADLLLHTKNSEWGLYLKAMFYWCISSYRRSDNERILIVCNFLKRRAFQNAEGKNQATTKAEFENEILEVLYDLPNETKEVNVDMQKLFVLINELYRLQIISISSYLRRLIASGIFYVIPGTDLLFNQQITMHLSILQNLPIMNNKQCDNILRKWTPGHSNYQLKFDDAKAYLREAFTEKILSNTVGPEFSECIEFCKSQKVGQKFLLSSWLTNELKTAISDSPKLIHMTPLIVSRLYEFYNVTDNLSLFFKVLVKFILRNDGKIIIYYLDTIFLISKLIIRHFKLLKFMPKTSLDSPTTAYELFEAIIMNYKDLLKRDIDCFDFASIWKFIDKVFDYEGDKEEYGNIKNSSSKFMDVDQTIADTPMKMKSDGKSNDKYTYNEFFNELQVLNENNPPGLLGESEIRDVVLSIGVQIAETSLEGIILGLLQFIQQNWYSLTEEKEIGLRRAFKSLTYLYGDILLHQIQSTVIDLSNEFSDQTVSFLKVLVYLDIISFDFATKVLLEDTRGHSKYFDLVFGRNELLEFTPQMLTLLNIARDKYSAKNQVIIFAAIIKSIQGSAYESPVFTDFGAEVISTIKRVVCSDTRLTIQVLQSTISKSDQFSILNELLGLHGKDKIIDLESLMAFTSQINELNLPYLQALSKFILQLQDSFDHTRFISNIMNNVHPLISNANFCIGEYHNYLSWDIMLQILEAAEQWGFKNLRIDVQGKKGYFVSLRNDEGMNLLPILKDYLKKFSANCSGEVPTSFETFMQLRSLLDKLLEVANSDDVPLNNKDVYDGTSILLRLLIIHNPTLTSVILTNDGERLTFYRHLVKFLHSRFLAHNEKLRILLYDLLLIMKSLVSQELIANYDGANGLSPETRNSTGEMGGGGVAPTAAAAASTAGAHLSTIFDIPEPSSDNPLGAYACDDSVLSVLSLTEDEISSSGDIHAVNNAGYRLRSLSGDLSTYLTGLLSATEVVPQRPITKQFTMRSYETLESTKHGINLARINLLLFSSFTTKENPP